VLPFFAHEAAGASGTRHPARPLGGETIFNDSGASRREARADALRLRDAKRLLLFEKFWLLEKVGLLKIWLFEK